LAFFVINDHANLSPLSLAAKFTDLPPRHTTSRLYQLQSMCDPSLTFVFISPAELIVTRPL
jgi:hypothetical protein